LGWQGVSLPFSLTARADPIDKGEIMGGVSKKNKTKRPTDFTGKRMLQALMMTMQRHEATFGVIENDVQRRVDRSAGQQAPQEASD